MQFRAGAYTLSLHHRVCWFRGKGGAWILKMPWARAYFSERYGHWPHKRFLGFRVGWRP